MANWHRVRSAQVTAQIAIVGLLVTGAGCVKAQSSARDGVKAAETAAAAAIRTGEFGLIVHRGSMGDTGSPSGVLCHTPNGEAPRIVAVFGGGSDYIQEPEQREAEYAAKYNEVIVEDRRYPERDICRVWTRNDAADRDRDRWITSPARAVTRPPLTLHEAARRGNAADVTRLANPSDLDRPDQSGMTPLAWATVRSNETVAEALIARGANPWAGPKQESVHGAQTAGAVYWAAALGMSAEFDRLRILAGRPFKSWPSRYLVAASRGGPDVLRSMLAEPHEPFPTYALQDRKITPAALELILHDNPELAQSALGPHGMFESNSTASVALALQHGADPNARNGVDTPLGVASAAIEADASRTVSLLLKAGADPNGISGCKRPIWHAVGSITLSQMTHRAGSNVRAMAVFEELLRAGADINLPDCKGVPPIRALLFPLSDDRDKLDASGVTPNLLSFLAHQGLDLNAEWEGKRVLPQVEAQAGHMSPLADTLRKLGGKE